MLRYILAGALCWAALASCEGRISGPLPVPDLGSAPGSGPGGGQGGEGPGTKPVRLDCSVGPYASSSRLRRLSQAQYRNAIRDVFDGSVSASRRYPLATGRSSTGFSTESELNEFAEQDVLDVLGAAEEVALALPVATLLPCSTGASPDAACLDRFIDTYARRAFRHDVSEAERGVLRAIHADAIADGSSFAEGVAILAAAMMQMPQFLYVAEEAAPAPRQLTGVEMASRLSFLYWDSIPDDALLDAAASGALDTAADVATQARRMLADTRADATLVRFFREWTGTEHVSPADKSAEMYPFFTNAFAASMNESFDRFVVGAVRDGVDLETLLVSPDVWVDANMASFFGVPAPASGWEKVSLDPAHQSGIMTQPAMMASLAHTTTTSYVYRGRFLRKRLMCRPVGAPPPDAQAQFNGLTMPENPTGRETSTVVRTNPTCNSCHGLMDPGGLAFEHFDALGKWRDAYVSGKSIDPADTMKDVGGHEVTFADHAQLMAALAGEAIAQHCFVEQVFRFAASRLPTPNDGCSIQGMSDDFQASSLAIDGPFLSVATTDAFRYRWDAP